MPPFTAATLSVQPNWPEQSSRAEKKYRLADLFDVILPVLLLASSRIFQCSLDEVSKHEYTSTMPTDN